MRTGELARDNHRWIFQPRNRVYRFIFLIILTVFFMYGFISYNLFLGSLFFFLFLYCLGVFKYRKKIDLLLNEDPVSVVSRITVLINSSRFEIKILTGSINPTVYCQEDVLFALDKALKRGVQVFFITNWQRALEKAGKNTNRVIEWAKTNRLKIYDWADKADNINHFIVVDKKSFRVEGIHNDESKNRLAVTAYNNKRALRFLNFFDSLIEKNATKPVYPENEFSIL